MNIFFFKVKNSNFFFFRFDSSMSMPDRGVQVQLVLKHLRFPELHLERGDQSGCQIYTG
jgi:hypothetical protein